MPGDAERLFALTERLVRVPSTTGQPEEGVRALEEFFRSASIPTDRLSSPGVSPVLVAGHPPRKGIPTFLLATHVDVVPVVRAPSHPLGTVEEGRLYGRGAADMKGGVALAMLLLQEFQADPRFNLGFVATTDEEAESAGAWALLEHLPVPPDLVLAPEPSAEQVVLSVNGRVVWHAQFVGEGGHGHHPRGTRPPNPLLALADLLQATTKEYVALRAWTEGSGEVTLPHSAHVRLDRLLPEGGDIASDRKRIERTVTSIAKRYRGLQGQVDLAERATPWLPGYRTDPKDRWVDLFLSCAGRDGKRAQGAHRGAVGDYNVFGSRFPTIVMGPHGEGFHADDEWVDLISLERCWHAYRRFLLSVPDARSAPSPRPAGARTTRALPKR